MSPPMLKNLDGTASTWLSRRGSSPTRAASDYEGTWLTRPASERRAAAMGFRQSVSITAATKRVEHSTASDPRTRWQMTWHPPRVQGSTAPRRCC